MMAAKKKATSKKGKLRNLPKSKSRSKKGLTGDELKVVKGGAGWDTRRSPLG
jgi:hypothetical protein